MQVETVVVGEFQVNCSIVAGVDGDCLIIDPGKDAPAIREMIDKMKLRVFAYLLTHAHMDHISGLAELVAVYPAPVACHPLDWAWAFSPGNSMPPFYARPDKPESVEYRELADDQVWTTAGLRYRVIETPGHTEGSVCFHFEGDGVLFSGDTLFAGSVGRTDLPGGNARQLSASLEKIAMLPDDTVICCGHGPDTTLAQEKRTNFFMQRLPAGREHP